MKSGKPGKATSTAELSNVSAHGMRLLVDERELYLPFDQFPWFREASIAQLSRVERPTPDHLRWPDLDRPSGAVSPGTWDRCRGARDVRPDLERGQVRRCILEGLTS